MIRNLQRFPIMLVLVVQLFSALFFLSILWGDVFFLRSRPLPYFFVEITQILASVSLIIGPAVTIVFIRRSQAVIQRLDQQIGAVSGQFQNQLRQHFDDWGLSQSEAEIAMFAMKGFSNSEIGALRGTSATTVKSQMNAIYRKSGFANRQQLIAFLVEELLNAVGESDGSMKSAA